MFYFGRWTEFSVDDIGRAFRVGGVNCRIIEVIDSTRIRMAQPPPAADLVSAPYGLGARLIGLPCEIVLPTTLVYLQDDANLNP
jgi:hypothetical protein